MMGTLKSKLTLVLAVVLITLVGNSFIFADGNGRATTPQEKAFYKRVMSVFDKAVPDGPSDWKLIHRSQVGELQYVGLGFEEKPFLVGYVLAWEDEARINAAVAAQKQDLSAKQLTERSATEEQSIDRLVQLVEEFDKAMARGDQAKVAQIQAEMEKVNNEVGAVEKGREEEADQIITKNSPHDVKFDVCLNANDFEALLDHSAKKETSIAGGLVMRTDSRIDGDYQTWIEGSTFVFLGGDWRIAKNGASWSVTAEPDQRLPYTTVQTIVVTVQGDPVRARKYLEAIDWKAIKGLLRK